MREIRQYQKSTDLLIAKLPFSRVVSLLWRAWPAIALARLRDVVRR